MADKHHSGYYVKGKQRELEKKQKESFFLSDDRDEDFSKAAMVDTESILDVKEKTQKQQEAINTQMHALDKNSPRRKDYEAYLERNQEYIDQVNQYENS